MLYKLAPMLAAIKVKLLRELKHYRITLMPYFNFIMIRKLLFIICFLFAGYTISYAQKYRTAIGPRIESDMFGVSIQQKIYERSTLEGIAAIGAREFSGTILYEWHRPILGERFNYYLGAGAHLGRLKDYGVFTGGDVILGIEYKVNGLPFLLSADIKPAVHINHENWISLSSGISVRYVILKEKKQKKSIWPFGKDKREEDTGFDIRKIFKKQEN